MPLGHHPGGRLEKGMNLKPSMHVDGESDGRVVPAKGSNKGGQPPAESLEGRRPTKENIEQPTAPRTQSRTSESSGLLGVRTVARKEKHTRFTALLHHVTVERLRDSVYALKRDAAPDIRAFFDTMDHGWLMRFLEQRIADRRMLRLIRTWMRAGVSEDGTWSKTDVGTPQGAVISPLLANIVLHYVFDLWVRRWRHRSATGDLIVVRYADDIVVGFEHRADAERFLHEWTDRMRAFGLALHPDKTRLIEFGRHAADHRKRRGESKPETFDFLGFTHLCGWTRKTGRFIVKRQTIRQRLTAKLHALKAALRHRWHVPVPPLGQWLRSVVQGWFNDHAVPGHMDRLHVFRSQVLRLWFRALRRRSQRRPMTWARFLRLVSRWIPSARILHPHPNVRFDATHPR